MNDQREEKRIWEPSCSTRSRTGCRVGKTSSSRSLGNLGKLPSKLHFSKMGHSVVPPFLECYVFFAFHVMSFLANFLLLFWYLLLLNRGPPTPAWEKFPFMLNFLQKKEGWNWNSKSNYIYAIILISYHLPILVKLLLILRMIYQYMVNWQQTFLIERTISPF